MTLCDGVRSPKPDKIGLFTDKGKNLVPTMPLRRQVGGRDADLETRIQLVRASGTGFRAKRQEANMLHLRGAQMQCSDDSVCQKQIRSRP